MALLTLAFAFLAAPFAMAEVPLEALDCGGAQGCEAGINMIQRDLKGMRRKRAEALKSYKSMQRSRKDLNVSQACSQRPWACEAPYNCQEFTEEVNKKGITHLATDDHTSNVQTWCDKADSPDNEFIDMVKECYAGNMVKSALISHEVQGRSKNLSGYPFVWDIDAADCFAHGGCTNTEVTENTTPEEADAMCDRRYGNEAWTSMGYQLIIDSGPPENGEHEDEWRLLACAMGNYHCDVFYCRVNYCNDPYYIKKYAHLTLKDPLLPVEGQEKSAAHFLAMHPEYKSLLEDDAAH